MNVHSPRVFACVYSLSLALAFGLCRQQRCPRSICNRYWPSYHVITCWCFMCLRYLQKHTIALLLLCCSYNPHLYIHIRALRQRRARARIPGIIPINLPRGYKLRVKFYICSLWCSRINLLFEGHVEVNQWCLKLRFSVYCDFYIIMQVTFFFLLNVFSILILQFCSWTKNCLSKEESRGSEWRHLGKVSRRVSLLLIHAL